ncbi:unnamed protein product [Psylliodes chrysocephalus]|uniref:Profilin n=1 Tax=Psylliodes chrysocephalus TaxID=3402493 RepID=A0A9P0CVA4_9CUCU|nr:unnamed protein product [Psylliodes chrysocephala]
MFKKSVVFVFWFLFFGNVLTLDTQPFIERLIQTRRFTGAAFVGNNHHVWSSMGIDIREEDIENLFGVFEPPYYPKLFLAGNVYFSHEPNNGKSFLARNVNEMGGIICFRSFKGILLGVYEHPVLQDEADQIMQEVAFTLLDT